MSYKTSNLLSDKDSTSIQLSNGILVHNQVDLDALGLSFYKKYFHNKESSNDSVESLDTQNSDLKPKPI